jgi:hypothetical protein
VISNFQKERLRNDLHASVSIFNNRHTGVVLSRTDGDHETFSIAIKGQPDEVAFRVRFSPEETVVFEKLGMGGDSSALIDWTSCIYASGAWFSHAIHRWWMQHPCSGRRSREASSQFA